MEAVSGVGPFAGHADPEAGSAAARAERSRASQVADWPNTGRLLPWLLFAFLAMLWVIPFDSINLPFGGPVDMTIDRPVLVLLAAVWLFGANALREGRPALTSPTHWAFGVFTLVAVLSVLANSETLVRLGELELSVKHLALLASYGAFFALAASIIRPTEVAKLTKAMLGLASITALGTIIEFRFGTNVFHEYIGPLFPGFVRPASIGAIDSIGRKEVLGPGIQPLAVAMMLTMALPFALSWLMQAKERRQRFLYATVVVLLVGGAVATQKKTSMVGPSVCILVLLLYRPRQMLRLAPLAVVVIGVVHLIAPGALGDVFDQLLPNQVGKVNTTQDRVSDYEAIRPDLVSHPLLGRGYESYDQKKHRILDNQYLTLGIGVGLLGLLSYLAIFGTAFLAAHRGSRSEDPERAAPALAAAAAIAAALVAGAILDFLAFPQLPYLFCFIAAIAVVLARDRLPRAARAAARPAEIAAVTR
jgi:O-antigen ligase